MVNGSQLLLLPVCHSAAVFFGVAGRVRRGHGVGMHVNVNVHT